VNDSLHVVGIGNAIVDVIASANDDFLTKHGMVKGTMQLIDEAKAELLYAEMGSTVVTSGGSAANTVAGIASFGGQTGFIGRVRDDALGAEFRHDITAVGARFPTPPATQGPATARCLIVVTPDAQRTMNTYLGACADLGPGDIDADLIRSARVTYLEGYLYDREPAKEAFHRASALAHEAGAKVALSLSDSFCVNRHRDAFLALVDHHVDILFANEAEIAALFESADFDASIARLRALTAVAAVTRDVKGSVIVTPERVIDVAAAPAAHVVDTTGAGDLYAAGFLFGLTNEAPLEACGRLGSLAAASVISHVGARPQTSLRELLAQA